MASSSRTLFPNIKEDMELNVISQWRFVKYFQSFDQWGDHPLHFSPPSSFSSTNSGRKANQLQAKGLVHTLTAKQELGKKKPRAGGR